MPALQCRDVAECFVRLVNACVEMSVLQSPCSEMFCASCQCMWQNASASMPRCSRMFCTTCQCMCRNVSAAKPMQWNVLCELSMHVAKCQCCNADVGSEMFCENCQCIWRNVSAAKCLRANWKLASCTRTELFLRRRIESERIVWALSQRIF
jgi:hypothetical protein